MLLTPAALMRSLSLTDFFRLMVHSTELLVRTWYLMSSSWAGRRRAGAHDEEVEE